MNDFYNNIIKLIGLTDYNGDFAVFIKLIIGLLLSFVVFFIINRGLLKIIRHFIHRSKTEWDDLLYEAHFFSKLTFIIPAILFKIFIANIQWKNLDYIDNVTDLWIVIAILMAILAFLNGIDKIYSVYEVSKNKPITVFIQILKIFFYTVTVIIIASILMGKSPEKLLYGLGAFTAVLMLVFKDSILGFVAGVQLMSNKMIAIGDWIEMPSGDANGEVLEINLYTVKVQNWDMTISTVPTYQLISQSFTNWRGMQMSQGRRIKRSFNIDISSVHFLSREEIESLKRSNFLNEYLTKMVENLDGYTPTGDINHLDTKHLTNLGVFRIYLTTWLKSNPNINNNMTMMVRQLQPTATGIPLEVYCFSAIQEWVGYEGVQSDLFDHILAVAPYFYVRIFQYPTNFFTSEMIGNKNV